MIVRVDTHKHVHVAVALDEFGGRIDAQRFTADSIGYRNLIDWAAFLGPTVSFGIEGTGSYGAGLASAVRRRGFSSIDVLHVAQTSPPRCSSSPVTTSSASTPKQRSRRTLAVQSGADQPWGPAHCSALKAAIAAESSGSLRLASVNGLAGP